LSDLILQMDKQVATWVWDKCSNVKFALPDNSYKGIGVSNSNGMLAGFVYSDWQPEFGTIEMSLAAVSPRWASRRIISFLLAYPFNDLDCQRISVVTSENNQKALRLAQGVGFVKEALIERHYGMNENAIVLRLFKEDWQLGKYGV